MKAILIVNVPNGYGEITDNEATICLKNWKLDTMLTICNVPLKPMPQKKILMKFEGRENKEYEGLVRGYNKCINEILGEEE